MNWYKIYGLSLRHIYLIKSSFPRILDLIYWPTIQSQQEMQQKLEEQKRAAQSQNQKLTNSSSSNVVMNNNQNFN